MEKVKEFITDRNCSSGSGYGSGYGFGYSDGSGDGFGSGYGDGFGDGSGDGSSYGDGFGYGSSYGDGFGYGSGSSYGDGFGYGSGYGYGDGFGYGSGYGSGYGFGVSEYDEHEVYLIDGVQTIISNVRGNVAKGFILNNDLTLEPCYIAKGHNLFAHGKTIRDAVDALREKIYESMDTEEVIEAFMAKFSDLDKKYPARAFYTWHHRLTGSCEMGRDAFVKDGGYDLENDTFTVAEFIAITRDSYGSEVIRQLENSINERRTRGDQN